MTACQSIAAVTMTKRRMTASPPQHAVEQLQQSHYDTIADRYDAHYSDAYSARYRDAFILKPLLADLDLRGKTVLEAMCGSGHAVGFLQSRGASVVGLDLSHTQVELFRTRWGSAPVLCRSIFDTGLPSSALDGVLIVGALHHLHPEVDRAIDEIFRVLKPGGYFCFMEPHSSSLLNRFRRAWYRLDPLFAANEAAIDCHQLERRNRPRFTIVHRRFGGSLGYLLVLQSLIFRVPPWIKRLYAPTLLWLEHFLAPITTERTGCFVLAVWKKT
jgi:SAM-dependent methyltransferase